MTDKCKRCGTGREPVFCMTCAYEMAEVTLEDAAQLPEVRAVVNLLKAYEWVLNGLTWYCPICDSPKREGHKEGCYFASTLAPFLEATDAST